MSQVEATSDLIVIVMFEMFPFWKKAGLPCAGARVTVAIDPTSGPVGGSGTSSRPSPKFTPYVVLRSSVPSVVCRRHHVERKRISPADCNFNMSWIGVERNESQIVTIYQEMEASDRKIQ